MNMQQLQLISKVVMFITFCIGTPLFITYEIANILFSTSFSTISTVITWLVVAVIFWLLTGLFSLMFQLSIMRFEEESK
jgi:uncharacterized protein HemY